MSLAIAPAGAQTSNAPLINIADGNGSTTTASSNAIVARAEERGRIPVIVELRLNGAPDGELSGEQSAALSFAQSNLLSNVPGALNVKRYETIPFVAMSVGPVGIRALLGNAEVVSITEDVAVPPTLNQSVPLINADKVSKRRVINGGKGWAVAVLDTGVQRNHPAFRNKIISEGCFSTTDRSQGSTSFCPGQRRTSVAVGSGKNCPGRYSGCDHGTHVAGIAVGNPNNAYKGVAPGASLIPMQVFSLFSPAACGSSSHCVLSYSSDQIAALERVLVLSRTRKIASVNMSLGGGQHSAACNRQNPALTRAINNLRQRRVAVVIASGNNGFTGSISSPACIGSAIAVGSTTKSDDVSWFSNHSRLVNVMAPGSDIRAPILGSKFGVKSGTSMATPHVAGAWALLMRAKPNATVPQVQKALQCSGKRVSRGGIVKPRINVEAALAALQRGRC